jgi:DNA adenine methylase
LQYLGGKKKLAKAIASAIEPKGIWWEPFCGGLSVSVQLASYCPGRISDINLALISTYCAVRDGWIPPDSISKEEYDLCRELPDTDPLKAFAGFGCSFSAKWFAGYDGISNVRSYTKKNEPTRTMLVNRVGAAKKSLLRDIPKLQNCEISWLSFFDIDPKFSCFVPESIYADPPYAGVTGYDHTPAFDHDLFWKYCQEWVLRGTRVFVSEYNCPVPHIVVLEKSQTTYMWSVGNQRKSPVERLFLVL